MPASAVARCPAAPEVQHGLAYGIVIASFAIEQFGLRGLEGLTPEAIEARRAEFLRSTHLAL